MKELQLPSRTITKDSSVYIIAEMSASHAGSLHYALELVHMAKECGADCIKTQTYTADTLTLNCRNKDFLIKGGLWDGYCYHDLYEKAMTPWEWQGKIMEEAKKVGIDFFSTPFDQTAVDFLEEIGVEFYKIAAFEMVDIPLIRYVASKRKPIIMSTGMATVEEIKEAVSTVYAERNEQLALLKCSSLYPAKLEDMNLITISDLKQRFGVITGLSDHTFGSVSAVLSVALGAKIIEKHICLDRNIPNNPDAGFSMEPEEFKQMVADIRNAETAIGTQPYTYAQTEIDSRNSRRSLYISLDMKKGDIFTPDNIRSVRPGFGLHTRYYEQILGKHIMQDAKMGTPLSWEMVDKI